MWARGCWTGKRHFVVEHFGGMLWDVPLEVTVKLQNRAVSLLSKVSLPAYAGYFLLTSVHKACVFFQISLDFRMIWCKIRADHLHATLMFCCMFCCRLRIFRSNVYKAYESPWHAYNFFKLVIGVEPHEAELATDQNPLSCMLTNLTDNVASNLSYLTRMSHVYCIRKTDTMLLIMAHVFTCMKVFVQACCIRWQTLLTLVSRVVRHCLWSVRCGCLYQASVP